MKQSDLARPLDTRVDEAEVLRQVQDAAGSWKRVLRQRLPRLARLRETPRQQQRPPA